MEEKSINEIKQQRTVLETQLKTLKEKEEAMERAKSSLAYVDDRVLIKKTRGIYLLEARCVSDVVVFNSSLNLNHFSQFVIADDIKKLRKETLILIQQLSKLLEQINEIK